MTSQGTVFVVEDDLAVRDSTVLFLLHRGWSVRAYDSAEAFLESIEPDAIGCLLLDIRMPGMSGLELQTVLKNRNVDLPIIFLTGHGDVRQSVTAIKGGAVDFLEKPYDQDKLHQRISDVIARHIEHRSQLAEVSQAEDCIKNLTRREREIMDLIVQGQSSKVIARELDISHRTVEVHRANVMRKMNVSSLAELATLAMKAGTQQD